MNNRVAGTKAHWDQIYASTPVQHLGWYEDTPSPSLRLLDNRQLDPDDTILDVGAGASTFVDRLVDRGFKNIIAADISPVGLSRLKERLGPEKASRVRWLVDDVTRPTELDRLRDVALWHDRAMFHFLTTDDQRQAYLTTLRHVLRPGGHVLVATFALDGAQKCSGLDVNNYDGSMLDSLLGADFSLIECFDHLYHMPSGAPRPFTYACLQDQGLSLAPGVGRLG